MQPTSQVPMNGLVPGGQFIFLGKLGAHTVVLLAANFPDEMYHPAGQPYFIWSFCLGIFFNIGVSAITRVLAPIMKIADMVVTKNVLVFIVILQKYQSL